MTAAASSGKALRLISSIGFSGAGFLTCYHLGVADCLLQQGILLKPGEIPTKHRHSPKLTGVSGGALTAAAMTAGILPQDGMDCLLQITDKTTRQGRLDALTPGYSLIDQVEDIFTTTMKQALGGKEDYDMELLQERLKESRLRVGFTDRRVFPPFGQNQRAYFYIDEFRNVEDIVAVCILSSYVPFITGPARGSLASSNLAVKRSKERVHEMLELGFVKHGDTGETVQPSNIQSETFFRGREFYWDGGLVNVWPVVDETTIIVTPICARFSPNPYISPAVKDKGDSMWNWIVPPTIRVNDRAEIHLNYSNMETLLQMTLSSHATVLQQRFAQGYGDARCVLNHRHTFCFQSQFSRNLTIVLSDAFWKRTTFLVCIQVAHLPLHRS